MDKVAPFEPVLSSKASSFFKGLSKPKQRKLMALLFQLSEHPFQVGDYSTADDTGRKIQHLGVGDWQFSFWADHSVRELRVTEISEL